MAHPRTRLAHVLRVSSTAILFYQVFFNVCLAASAAIKASLSLSHALSLFCSLTVSLSTFLSYSLSLPLSLAKHRTCLFVIPVSLSLSLSVFFSQVHTRTCSHLSHPSKPCSESCSISISSYTVSVQQVTKKLDSSLSDF